MTRGRDADFQVMAFERIPFTHEEKQVDVALSTTTMDIRAACKPNKVSQPDAVCLRGAITWQSALHRA